MLFKGLGKLESEHVIHPRERAKPFCFNTRRIVPLQLLKKVQEEIMGPNPTRSLSRAESKLDLRASSCTVCSRKGDLGVARCQQF